MPGQFEKTVNPGDIGCDIRIAPVIQVSIPDADDQNELSPGAGAVRVAAGRVNPMLMPACHRPASPSGGGSRGWHYTRQHGGDSRGCGERQDQAGAAVHRTTPLDWDERCGLQPR
jgi:hypothetical protein